MGEGHGGVGEEEHQVHQAPPEAPGDLQEQERRSRPSSPQGHSVRRLRDHGLAVQRREFALLILCDSYFKACRVFEVYTLKVYPLPG